MGKSKFDLDYSIHKVESSIIRWLVLSGMPISFLMFNSLSGYSNTLKIIIDNYASSRLLLATLQVLIMVYMIVLAIMWVYCAIYENEHFEKWIKFDNLKGQNIFMFVISGISISALLGVMAANAVYIKEFLIFYAIYSTIDLIMLMMRKKTIKYFLKRNIFVVKQEIENLTGNIDLNEDKSKEIRILEVFCEAHKTFELFHIKRPLLTRVFFQSISSIILCALAHYNYYFFISEELIYICLLFVAFASELTIYTWRKRFYSDIDAHKSKLFYING